MISQKERQLTKDLIFWIIIAITILIGYFILLNNYTSLQKENQELKDQIGKEEWTLNYNCNWSNIGIRYEARYVFTDYNRYLEQIEILKVLDCEVNPSNTKWVNPHNIRFNKTATFYCSNDGKTCEVKT